MLQGLPGLFEQCGEALPAALHQVLRNPDQVQREESESGVLYIVIILLIGKYLWNRVVAGSGSGKGLFTVIEPVDNIIELLGLYVFAMIFLQ